MEFTATEIAAAVQSGMLTTRAATQQALHRIEQTQPAFNAWQVIRNDAALAEADAIDARDDRGSLPLAGVPIAIKDNIAVAGEPMRDGSLATSVAPRTTDHEVVRRLRAAGAVIVGLTRFPELRIWGATDSAFGVTRNPWNPERTPGGSSGGPRLRSHRERTHRPRERRHGLDSDPGCMLRIGWPQAWSQGSAGRRGARILGRDVGERTTRDHGRRCRADVLGDGRRSRCRGADRSAHPADRCVDVGPQSRDTGSGHADEHDRTGVVDGGSCSRCTCLDGRLPLGAPQPILVCQLATMAPLRSSHLCERRMAEVPADAPVRAERRKRLRWFSHQLDTGIGICGLLVPAAAIAVAGGLLGSPTIHRLARIPLDVLVLTSLYSTWLHHRLRPWCPSCRDWDEGGDPEPSPDPSEFKTRTG